MKKNIFTISLIFVIIMVVLYMNYHDLRKKQLESLKFNQMYEEYNKEDLNGLDITTVIYKAIDNNEKYEIEKDENGVYIADDSYSVKIYITLAKNEKTYTMEKINAVGMEAFIQNFGIIEFKCKEIKYHEKTGRISELTFEATDY